MTKFFMRWEVDSAFIPDDPEERTKQWLKMLEMVKADIKEGITADWGLCSGELAGHSVTADTTAEKVNTNLLRWMPYVKFEVSPVLTVDQTMKSIKTAAESMKK